ncbi:MAG: hypothetical protein LBH59_08200 [Planctomycetaceae bacterium]|jgi:hypothetical protein|nr:hypothetical protein [Planctomycetaceae bacterium]
MNKKYFLVMLPILVTIILSNLSFSQDNKTPPKPEPRVQKVAGLNARFIVALIDDGEGGAWVGTEDDGVFHCQSNSTIQQFTVQNTNKQLGDNNAYALAIDKLGRLWVGHLNSGVSVFNGKSWQNYDVVDGTIGERIFDIAICPKDGDVWMATSAGITRYKIDKDEWEHFTRDDKLPEDQAAALAFKNDGTLIVGTQCHGLSIFIRNVNGEYKHSKNISAPERFGVNNCSPVPLTPTGTTLPSNQINDIIVTKNSNVETIWIATSAGLVKANNDLTKLEYWRGKDYVDKVRGLYGGAPNDFQLAPKEIMDRLLPEDYLTCLAEAEQGAIWIGTRQNGFVIVDSQIGDQMLSIKMGLPDNFVTKILIVGDGNYLVGTYGGGIIKPIEPLKLIDHKPLKTAFDKDKIFSVAQNEFSKLPSKIKPPTAKELRATFYNLKEIKVESKPPKVLTLNDDWRTKGDWIDRHGRYSTVLCAIRNGMNGYDGSFADAVQFAGGIGQNFKAKKDSLRHWIHWLQSDDKRVLQFSAEGGRRQSSWGDHKEVYPITLDGPHIYITCKMPAGRHLVSFYFFNKDGHDGKNKLRDFILSAKVFKLPNGFFEKLQNEEAYVEPLFLQAPKGEQTRIKDFWGGVYKRFYVDVKEGEYAVFKVDSHYSFSTIVSGVFVDPVGKLQTSHEFPDQFPRHELKQWAKIIENPVEYWWWGNNVIDWTLYQRDQNPIWFHKNSRKHILPIIRSFVRMRDGLPYAPEEIDADAKVMIRMIRYDLTQLVEAVQLFSVGDHIFYGDKKYNTHGWEERTKLGRERYLEYKWDWDVFYYKFVEQKVNQHTYM